ncbi:hypothetical protein NE619_13675 [Anaerovorax odorimutans]|uniref:Uncharacterized protein n=1 Tax=Anaerovorax odorimutans TaxID=109327 RepID=A0ABT1RRK3_9FIRM|nr:hypothetical protein [Anaerovorax odorimutans]
MILKIGTKKDSIQLIPGFLTVTLENAMGERKDKTRKEGYQCKSCGK